MLLSIPPRAPAIMQDASDDALQYISTGAQARAYAVGGPLYGLPARPENRLPAEVDRPAPAYTNPNKTDADVKSAQYAKLAGIKGTSVLSRADFRFGRKGESRMLTARGTATRNVPNTLSGEVPDMRCAVAPTDGTDMTVTGDEIRYLRRYREAMRGPKFAASMKREATERDLAFWRAANPWIPCDSHGKPWKGTGYNRLDGIGERIYSDGSMLSERYAEWKAKQQTANEQLDRDAEIARLVAESIEETRATRTKKVQAEREAVVTALRF